MTSRQGQGHRCNLASHLDKEPRVETVREEISALLNAASTGQVTAVIEKVCTACTIDVSDTNRETNGKTALWFAIEKGDNVAVETLLKAGANVNKIGDSRRTPLMFATDRGHAKYVQAILQAGAKIDSFDSSGMSSLMVASKKGHLECLRILITAGANVHLRDNRGRTSLMIAVEENSCGCLQYLIQSGATIEDVNFEGVSPLLTAIYKKCKQCVGNLVQAGALIDEVQECGKTALMVAIEKSDILAVLMHPKANLDLGDSKGRTPVMQAAIAGQIDSLLLLIQGGADLDKVDIFEQTALILAAAADQEKSVECLVNAGAKLELQDVKGLTALMVAACNNHYVCLQIILQGGGKKLIDLQNKDGKTALSYAVEFLYERVGCRHTRTWLSRGLVNPSYRENCLGYEETDNSSKCVQALLKAGANPNICDKEGISPLMHAVTMDTDDESLQNLIDAVADIDLVDKLQKTALAHAAAQGNCRYIMRLVDAGASVNTVSNTGETPLIYLAKKTDDWFVCDFMSYLLDHGADINAQDYLGMTPLMWAARCHKNVEVLSFLVSRGAKFDMVDNRGSCVLYHSFNSHYVYENIEFLLKKGANPNRKNALNGTSVFSSLIRCKSDELMKHLLRNTTVEPQVEWEDFKTMFSHNWKMLQIMVSHCIMPPLAVPSQDRDDDRLSVIRMDYDIASLKYCFLVGYFNSYDTTYRKDSFRNVDSESQNLWNRSGEEFTSFVNNAYSQPWPLVKLSFVAVSSNLGSGADRKDRIGRSGLPDRLQRMLLFQDPISKLCIYRWKLIPFCFDPQEYEKLPKPRPLLFYWPFGQDLVRCSCCNYAGYKCVSQD